MIIKRYIVNNMNEAMTRIRYELGKDAVIISQRRIRKPGLKGLFSKKVIEVTAAMENAKKEQEDTFNDSIDAIKKMMEKEQLHRAETKNVRAVEKKEEIMVPEKKIPKKEEQLPTSDLMREMQEMKSMLQSLKPQTIETTQEKNEIGMLLEENDVNESIILQIQKEYSGLQGIEDDKKKMRIALEKHIAAEKIDLDGRVVLVGPTGVGKTTTIAKLAGRISLIEKRKVGLITIDTYRIGAVEQLKTYADIMNIPFKVVFTMKEMDAALESMKDCDVVLIDTTGRSSKNMMQISELRAFIDKASTDNIHLVLSCTTKNKDIHSIISGFGALNFNHVIITKLDETTTYGSIVNILETAKKPLSFVTTGQNVPDDIKCLQATDISNLILGEDTIC